MAAPLLALAAAGTALKIAGSYKSASAARRAADNRATALKAQAQKRLAKGKIQSEQALLEGELNSTSAATAYLSRGGSRENLLSDISLDEITKRARFESNQALEDAQAEADAMGSDAQDIVAQSRAAQKAANYEAAGSILSLGSSYGQARYGNDAAKMSRLWGGK